MKIFSRRKAEDIGGGVLLSRIIFIMGLFVLFVPITIGVLAIEEEKAVPLCEERLPFSEISPRFSSSLNGKHCSVEMKYEGGLYVVEIWEISGKGGEKVSLLGRDQCRLGGESNFDQ